MPAFVADDPQMVEIAERAWEGAVACTGREAAAHGTVYLRTSGLRSGEDGYAAADRQGLYEIVVAPRLLASAVDRSGFERAIAHEIAHAWTRGGHHGLTEGRAELLADCIYTRSGVGELSRDPGGFVMDAPDLRHWLSRDHRSAIVEGEGYVASSRLWRAIALVLPQDELWADDELTWRELVRLLDAHGWRGREILAALGGGWTTQTMALADFDGDGLPELAEEMLGTDPDRWDTDGDLWWDGARAGGAPTGVHPLPGDGSPVCSGVRATGGDVRVVGGFQMRSGDAHVALVRGDDPTLEAVGDRVVEAPAGVPLLLAGAYPDGGWVGGVWARLEGAVAPDDTCWTTGRYTIWGVDPGQRDAYRAFVGAVDRALPATPVDPADGERLIVQLGGPCHARAGLLCVDLPPERIRDEADALAAAAVAAVRGGDPSALAKAAR